MWYFPFRSSWAAAYSCSKASGMMWSTSVSCLMLSCLCNCGAEIYFVFRSLYLKRVMRKTLQLLLKKQFRRPPAMDQMLFLLTQLVECRYFPCSILYRLFSFSLLSIYNSFYIYIYFFTFICHYIICLVLTGQWAVDACTVQANICQQSWSSTFCRGGVGW